MASSSVLRSVVCRALRRPSSSFPRALDGNEQRFLHRSPLPMEFNSPRRLYGSDCAGKPELNKNSHVDPYTRLHNSGHEKHTLSQKKVPTEKCLSLKLEGIGRKVERRGILLKELEVAMREKNKRVRRRRLLCGSILVGLGIYVKQRFFGGSEEANKGTTESS